MTSDEPSRVPDAYTSLHAEIVAGRRRPGERLVEEDLARRYGTSRAAVRNALVRLEVEGLIVRERHRGATVRSISLDEAREILDARAVLESVLARRAAERCDDTDRARLTATLTAMRSAVASGDRREYSQLNAILHRHIVAAARQRLVASFLAQLELQALRAQYRAALLPGRVDASLREHEAIVAAILAGDGAGAETTMRRHLAHVTDAVDELAKLGFDD